MAAYEPFTKIETGKDGSEIAVCRFSGTSECRSIHTSNGCNGCPILRAAFQMLHTFEQIYLSDDKEENEYSNCN